MPAEAKKVARTAVDDEVAESTAALPPVAPVRTADAMTFLGHTLSGPTTARPVLPWLQYVLAVPKR